MTTTTPTAASTYQQLRGHLLDLKLADAAEALLSRPRYSVRTVCESSVSI